MTAVRVILSPEAENIYNHLNEYALDSKKERMILEAVKNKVELIKINTHYGDPISKKNLYLENIN